MPQVNISIEREGAGFHETVSHLKRAGLKVENEMEMLGVVSGSISEARRAGLGKIPGVGAVALDASVELPPIDSPVQ
ncbi:MAG TPA: hypothetical protein VGO11_03355 [Chthoniobacteraceae bacterium]|jgi:hypothetical protein|nr:hypothetical protein [Chthoniobacteraceae bacterium]